MPRNVLKYSTIVLLFATQVTFLFNIFSETSTGYLVTLMVLSISLLLCYNYLRHPIHRKAYEFESIKIALWVPLGSLSTFYLNQGLQWGPVLAAASVGLIASFIPKLFKKRHDANQIPIAVYCGAFVGMSGPKIATGPVFVLFAGILTGLFLIISKSIMPGVGGKLGTLAFIGVALAYLLISITQ